MQLEHFKVPVYPVPKTPAHVAPPKALPSHCSVPSIRLFPQQEVIEICEHMLFEHVSVVQTLLSLH
jgi:hypothetical protein